MKKFVKEFIKFKEEFHGHPYRSYFHEMSDENIIRLFTIYLNKKGVKKR